ncbi:hypothetical protein J3R83DRAFT_8707 [Lanmaoa asiatica]|nr:hypothetical protein J3R83DRAFT_8707 [Lanmaoa asiatica]
MASNTISKPPKQVIKLFEKAKVGLKDWDPKKRNHENDLNDKLAKSIKKAKTNLQEGAVFKLPTSGIRTNSIWHNSPVQMLSQPVGSLGRLGTVIRQHPFQD